VGVDFPPLEAGGLAIYKDKRNWLHA